MATKDFEFALFLTPHGTAQEPSYMLTNSPMDALPGFVRVKDVHFTVELPEPDDVRQQRLAALDAQERDLQAQYRAAMTEVARKRSELLCLENTVEA